MQEGFQKTQAYPLDMSRIFGSLHAQEIGADQVKNRSIQVLILSILNKGIVYEKETFLSNEKILLHLLT